MALCVRAASMRGETLHPPQFPLVSTFHGHYAHVEIGQRRSELSLTFSSVVRATFHVPRRLWTSDPDDFEFFANSPTCREFYVRLLIGRIRSKLWGM